MPVTEGASVASDSSRYRVLCEIGQGGMASVHLALLSGDAGFRKLVALKQPKAGLSQDSEFLEMFMNEARLAARLNHPNVVQTYEVGRHDSEPFIAMEFLEGQPLHRLQRVAPTGIPLAIHLRIIAEALAGLHHAHELRDFSGAPLSVVHRDVSPQNVLVSYDGQAKVVDFGIAKAATHASFTDLGLVKGKLPYMSPEQTLGETLDRRADLFAIGVMLWEAAAGRRLWPGESARSRLRLLSLGEIPPFSQLDHEVPDELERICRRTLEYSPARRYQTAAELEADLEALRAEPGLHATRRDVVAFMHTHFDAQRKRMLQLIEAELGHFSLNDVVPLPSAPLGNKPEQEIPKTRRVLAPVSSLLTLDEREETGSSIAPAMATVNGKLEAPRSGRRWLGLLIAGIAAAPTLALIWNAHSSTSNAASPASSSVALASLAASLAAVPSSVATTVVAPPNSVDIAPKGPPAVRKKLGKQRIAEGESASLPATVPEPPAPEAESGIELRRERPLVKRAPRALDTSDPWAN